LKIICAEAYCPSLNKESALLKSFESWVKMVDFCAEIETVILKKKMKKSQEVLRIVILF
jgi:hypothetical protein